MKKIILAIILSFSLYIIRGITMAYSYKDFNHPQQQVLAKAIKQQDMEKIEKLIPQIEVNQLSNKHMSLLMFTILQIVESPKKDNDILYKTITLLMQHGANIFILEGSNSDSDGISVFGVISASKAPARILQSLIEGGLDPNHKQTEYFNSPIIFSFLGDEKLDKLKVLVNAGSNINVKTADGSTYLVINASYSNPDTTLYLLQSGAEFNSNTIKSSRGMTVSYIIYTNILELEKRINNFKVKTKQDEDVLMNTKENLMKFNKIKDFLIEHGEKWPPDIPEKLQDVFNKRYR